MKQLIYIRVLDFPAGLLQAVQAVHVHGSCYRMTESSDDPDHDPWEFESGDIVQCNTVVFSEGETGLVGVAACSCSGNVRQP